MALFSPKKVALDLQSISTLVSEGSFLDGDLKAPAYARIDGKITGDVHIDEGLILGAKGTILGNVHTKELVVCGTIEGNIRVNSLEIKATGRIAGEIETKTLLVENGAVYNGSLTMIQSTTPVKTIAAALPVTEMEEVS